VVSAYGDVDPGTAPELERELLEAVQLGARLVVVDLTEAAFFDSSAIHTLLTSAERVRAVGGKLSVVCDNPNIKKVFAITGTDRALPIHSTIEQALSLTPSGDAPLEPRPPGSYPVATGSEIIRNGGTARRAARGLASQAQHLRRGAWGLRAGPRFRAKDALSTHDEERTPA
jgi:anti-sigma B factor antagonist